MERSTPPVGKSVKRRVGAGQKTPRNSPASGRGKPRSSAPAAHEEKQLKELRRDLDALANRVDSVLQGEDWIQSKLYDLNLSLATLAQAQSGNGSEGESSPIVPGTGDAAYTACVRKIRETVRRALPRDATVVVVTKGDEGLLDLYGRRAWHFPQDSDGTYLWYYPPDGPSVIAQLESLRMQGAQYLLFPEPALWWLDRYPEFSSHLQRHYSVLLRDEKCCVIFSLEENGTTSDAQSFSVRLLQLITAYADQTGAEPSILDWNSGLDVTERFPGQAVLLPPDDARGLPYLDRSIDIVVVSSSDKAILREARRVAVYAVVATTSPEQTIDDHTPDADADADVTVQRIDEAAERLQMPSCSIIIPTHDGVEHLKLCLSSLDETLPESFLGEIIVVDDGSGADMQALFEEWQTSRAHFKVVRNARNRGFVASCNRGARTAKSDILVFLNDDTIPQAGWLQALLRTFRDHPDAGAVGGKLLYPDGRLQEAGNFVFADGSAANFGRDDRVIEAPLYNYLRKADYCSGALLATPRALFSEIGGFDKRYEPGYYEDADYCFEVRKHGKHVYYQPESVVVHTEGATGGTDLTAGAKRYQVLNQAKFAKKWRETLREQPKRPNQLDIATAFGLVLRAPRA
jgi:GT2 family glycosyltransferase